MSPDEERRFHNLVDACNEVAMALGLDALYSVDDLAPAARSLTEENERLGGRATNADSFILTELASERARAEKAEGDAREFANTLAEVVAEREGLRRSLSEAERRAASLTEENERKDRELERSRGTWEYLTAKLAETENQLAFERARAEAAEALVATQQGTGNCPECDFASAVSLDADRVPVWCSNQWHPTRRAEVSDDELIARVRKELEMSDRAMWDEYGSGDFYAPSEDCTAALEALARVESQLSTQAEELERLRARVEDFLDALSFHNDDVEGWLPSVEALRQALQPPAQQGEPK